MAQAEAAPTLTGEVTLPVLAFLELTQGAGLSLAQVTAMAGGGAVRQATPLIRLLAEGASLARVGQGPGCWTFPDCSEGAVGPSSACNRGADSGWARTVQGLPQDNAGGVRVTVTSEQGDRRVGSQESRDQGHEVAEQLRKWGRAVEVGWPKGRETAR